MRHDVQHLPPAARTQRGQSPEGRTVGGLSPSRSEAGISLIDVLVVVALIGIISAIAVPNMLAAADSIRLGQAARNVERVLQTARQRAVSSKRPIRVRFNCPAAGWYRAVELIGSTRSPATADGSTDRCRPSVYPFPAADSNPATRPNLDGPANVLDPNVTFGTATTIEFWADGTAHAQSGTGTPWPQVSTTGATVTLTRTTSAGTRTATITINGNGKVQLLPIP